MHFRLPLHPFAFGVYNEITMETRVWLSFVNALVVEVLLAKMSENFPNSEFPQTL